MTNICGLMAIVKCVAEFAESMGNGSWGADCDNGGCGSAGAICGSEGEVERGRLLSWARVMLARPKRPGCRG